MAATINDVAKEAGVSPSTVSLVLNNKGSITPETKEKVMKAVQHIGYSPRRYDQKKQDVKNNKIGIIYNNRFHGSDLASNPFYGEVMEGVEEALRDHNYHIFFKTVTGNYETDIEEVNRLIEDQELAGLILASYEIDRNLIINIHDSKIPFVLVDNDLWDENIDCVMSDNIRGARRMVNHLIELGHQRIAFISGPLSHTCLDERYIGYRQALREANIEFDETMVNIQKKAGFFVEEGYRATMELFTKRTVKPTAIFAAADVLAIGAMKALHELGYRIPEDVSVAGFDDIAMAQHTIPPLTTVRIFKREMGNLAGKRLFELINHTNPKAIKLTVSVELVLRETTGPVKED
jgi:DNA-binding LacI/PurR family transcriptional regulator